MDEAINNSLDKATIKDAEKMLASVDDNTRWQGAILLGEFCATAPETIWPAVVRWGSSPDADMRAAIGTCVLEHIFEHHFDPFFERACELITEGNTAFADTMQGCWWLGQAGRSPNTKRVDAFLKKMGWVPRIKMPARRRL